MKKLLGILVLGLIVWGIYNAISDSFKFRSLKKETFECAGISTAGVNNVNVLATFSIDPTKKTITFQHSGKLIGSILPFPKKLVYDIKEAKGDIIKTKTHYWSWKNLVGDNKITKSHLSTYDNKKSFTFLKHGGLYEKVQVNFENCKKIN